MNVIFSECRVQPNPKKNRNWNRSAPCPHLGLLNSAFPLKRAPRVLRTASPLVLDAGASATSLALRPKCYVAGSVTTRLGLEPTLTLTLTTTLILPLCHRRRSCGRHQHRVPPRLTHSRSFALFLFAVGALKVGGTLVDMEWLLPPSPLRTAACSTAATSYPPAFLSRR